MDIEIKQGKTFSLVLRYASDPLVFKPITSITRAAPAVLWVPGHGMPDGWVGAISGVIGMDEINAEHEPPRSYDFLQITKIDADHVSVPVDASLFTAYKSGGYLRYYTPVDLTGASVEMRVRDRVGGTSLLDLTSGNGDIALDNTLKTITITATAAQTAGLDFDSAVYEVVLTANGVVTQIVEGAVALELGVV
jgi:hypothetical protein